MSNAAKKHGGSIVALGGGLLLATLVSPVLCLVFFKHPKPVKDNFLVRWLKYVYVNQVDFYLRHRLGVVATWLVLLLGTVAVLPSLGREFMPELEEGNSWIRGTFRINSSLETISEKTETIRAVLRRYPEVEAVVSQIGRPDEPFRLLRKHTNPPAAAWARGFKF